MSNPLLLAALGSVVRWALVLLSAWCVQHGIWTEADAPAYIDKLAQWLIEALLGLAPLAWAIYRNYTGRRKLVTALALDTPMSEHALEHHIAWGNAAPVSTPKHAVPAATLTP